MSLAVKVALWLVGLPTTLVALIVAKVLAGQVQNALRYRLAGCNIPAAPEKPFYGSRTKKPFHQERLDDFKNLGPIFYSSIFSYPSITVGDPELIQHVLLKENFPKSPTYDRLKKLWGDSIVTMQHGKDGPWKDHRHLVNPAFKLSAIRALHRVFVDKSVDLAEKLTRYATNKEVFDFQADVSMLTMDIISASGFGHDLGAFKGKTKDPFFMAVQGIFERIKHPLVFLGFTSLVNYLARKERAVVRDLFNKIIDERIRQRQENPKKEEDKDILDIFLEPGEDGRQMSREQIHHELFIFFLAGHETTATTLSWTLYLLTQNPDVEERLFQEIESVMGPPKADKVQVPTAAEVEEMPYMTMVLNESLRLFPPATAVVRVIPETFEYKGLIFPKGVEIGCSPLVTHRNAEIWPNPEKFDPERFSKENSAGRHLCAFMPFSAGQRICLGRNFFYEEAKTILATMLLNFKFHADPTRESGTMTSTTTLRPNAVWVSVTKRTEA